MNSNTLRCRASLAIVIALCSSCDLGRLMGPGAHGAAHLTVSSSLDTLLAVGTSAQLVAAVVDHQGQALENAPITWTSSNPQVAPVNSTGLVTALVAGSARITAQTANVTGGLRLAVLASNLNEASEVAKDSLVLRIASDLQHPIAPALIQNLNSLASAINNGNIAAALTAIRECETQLATVTDPVNAVTTSAIGLFLTEIRRELLP